MKILLLLLVFFLNSFAFELEHVDSLLQEAIYIQQVKGEKDSAIKIFKQILVYPYSTEKEREFAKMGICLSGGHRKKQTDTLVAEKKETISPLLWTRNFAQGKLSKVAVFKDKFLFSTSEGYLFCAEASTGRAFWAIRNSGNGRIAPIVLDESVLSYSLTGQLSLYDIESGKFKKDFGIWPRITFLKKFSKSLIIIVSGKNIALLDVKTKKLKWQKNINADAWISKVPLIFNNTIKVLSPGFGLTSINSDNGSINWVYKGDFSSMNSFENGNIILSANKKILSIKTNGKLLWNRTFIKSAKTFVQIPNLGLLLGFGYKEYLLLNSNNGEIKKRVSLDKGINFYNSGLILGVNDFGKLSVYDITFKKLWSFSTGETNGTVYTKANNKIYLGTNSSKIYCYNLKNKSVIPPIASKSILEVNSLFKKGDYKTALNLANKSLSTIEPGNTELLELKAIILSKIGDKKDALKAWRNYITRNGLDRISDSLISSQIALVTGSSIITKTNSNVRAISLLNTSDGGIISVESNEINFYNNWGKLEWVYRFEERSIEQCIESNGNLYAYAGKKVFCLDLHKREKKWEIETLGNFTGLSCGKNNIILGTWDKGILIVDNKTGKIIKHLSKDKKALFPFYNVDKFLFIGLNGDFLGLVDNTTYSIDLLIGKLSAIPAKIGSELLLSNHLGELISLSIDNEKLLWRISLGQPLAAVSSTEYSIAILTSGGVLVNLNRNTGNVIWSRRVGSPAVEKIEGDKDYLYLPTSKGIIVFSRKDGKILDKYLTVGSVQNLHKTKDGLIVLDTFGIYYLFNK